MINTNILKYTQLQHAIFLLLCKTAGSKINQRTMATKLHVTSAAVGRALSQLEKDQLIVIQKPGKMNLKEIELNRENHRVIQLKRVENLRALYLSNFVEYITEQYAGSTIILFGSYAKGEDTINSDIDIAVIGSKEKNIDLHLFQKTLEREIRITYLDTLDNVAKEFKENLCNGIVLAGGITL